MFCSKHQTKTTDTVCQDTFSMHSTEEKDNSYRCNNRVNITDFSLVLSSGLFSDIISISSSTMSVSISLTSFVSCNITNELSRVCLDNDTDCDSVSDIIAFDIISDDDSWELFA